MKSIDFLCVVNYRSSVAQLSTANLLAGSNARPTCLTLQGLSPGQARICELFRDHMPAVGAGAKAAISVSFCSLLSSFLDFNISVD